MKSIHASLCLIVLAAAGWNAASAAPQPTSAPALDRKYVDPIHGFSIRPPVDTQRVRDTSGSRLVKWVRYDAKTGAVAWSLNIVQALESEKDASLKAFADSLANKLRTEQGFTVESVRLAPVAGKGAIFIEGLTGGVRLWQRQVWISVEPGRYLIVLISGAEALKDEMIAVSNASLATLEVHDPQQALEAGKKALDAGQDVLAGLTDKKLAGIVISEPQWFLVKFKGKDVGFLVQKEASATRDGNAGLEVKTYLSMQLPNDLLRLRKQVLFAAAGRNQENWTETLLVGEGATTMKNIEEGLKQGTMIVCSTTQGDQTRSQKKPVPAGIYLPRALGAVLGRLVNLKEPGTYAFAMYSSIGNTFDMRKFTVVGPDKIKMGESETPVIRVSDQAAADADAATLYLDEKGRMLRLESVEGLVIEAAPEAIVLRHFPKAKETLQRLDD